MLSGQRIVAVLGAVSHPSKTTALVRSMADQVASRMGGQIELVEVAALQPEFGQSLLSSVMTPTLKRAVATIELTDFLVVASPVFKASYSGLFKYLFDLVDPYALRGTPVILGATGGSERHTLMADYELRPLFQYFQAIMALESIFATSADFKAYELITPSIHHRIGSAIEYLASHRRPPSYQPGLIR